MTTPHLHVITGGQATTRPGSQNRVRHGYLCECLTCRYEVATLTSTPKRCRCERPGLTDEDRCLSCGRAARPALRAA